MSAVAQESTSNIDNATFEAVRKLVFEQSGISLRGDKQTLVAGRLAKRVRHLGLPSYRAYMSYLASDPTGAELTHLLDAISTNVTSFFREPDHFELLRDLYAEWRSKGQTRFRFWCAASSSGEEPYTIAITLQEGGVRGVDAKLLATDISTEVLRLAMRGRYTARSVEPVSARLLSQYFERSGNDYQVSSKLRQMVAFRQANLSKLPISLSGPLDMIFCRNVMIYFEDALRGRLAAEYERLLKPGGYLVVGHSESLVGIQGSLEMIRPSVYRKPVGR